MIPVSRVRAFCYAYPDSLLVSSQAPRRSFNTRRVSNASERVNEQRTERKLDSIKIYCSSRVCVAALCLPVEAVEVALGARASVNRRVSYSDASL